MTSLRTLSVFFISADLSAKDLTKDLYLASPKIKDHGLKKFIVDLAEMDNELLYNDTHVWYKNGYSPNCEYSIKWLSIEVGVSTSTITRTYKRIKENKKLTDWIPKPDLRRKGLSFKTLKQLRSHIKKWEKQGWKPRFRGRCGPYG